MSIRLLEVEGFKSLKEVSWHPGHLNVVIGPNGSGKSNLLDLLELIRSAAVGKLRESIQEQGGMDALLWDGRSSAVQIVLEALDDVLPTDRRDYFRYELAGARVSPWGGGFLVTRERLESFEHQPQFSSIVAIEREQGRASIYHPESKSLVAIEQKLPADEALLATGSLPLVTYEISALNDQLESWAIYKGLDTRRDAPVRQAILTSRESVVASDGENLVAVLHTLYTDNRNFRDDLNAAMRTAFSDGFEELIFPPASDQRIQMRVNWKHLKRSQSSAMLSDGTLRFLYLMAILANPEPPSLIAIEEPEVGLHPSMFPIIAEYAAQAAQKTQVIFTTHSADFLDAFRHTGTTPTTTVTQWRDGATHLKVLEADELAYWLREYTLGQLFRSSELEQIG